MPQGRPPLSTTTRLYGHFTHATGQRSMSLPALMNALLDQRGVDAIGCLASVCRTLHGGCRGHAARIRGVADCAPQGAGAAYVLCCSRMPAQVVNAVRSTRMAG
jgi:hypothetical protein